MPLFIDQSVGYPIKMVWRICALRQSIDRSSNGDDVDNNVDEHCDAGGQGPDVQMDFLLPSNRIKAANEPSFLS